MKNSNPNPSDAAQPIESHLDLVRQIAYRVLRLAPIGVDVQDLIQEGSFGLMEAAAKFIPARGVRFDAFASPFISGRMLNSLSRGGQKLARYPLDAAADVDQVAASSLPPGQRLMRGELVAAIYAGMSRREAICFGFRYQDGFSCKEIAQFTGLCASTVKTTLRRLIQRLQQDQHLRQLAGVCAQSALPDPATVSKTIFPSGGAKARAARWRQGRRRRDAARATGGQAAMRPAQDGPLPKPLRLEPGQCPRKVPERMTA